MGWAGEPNMKCSISMNDKSSKDINMSVCFGCGGDENNPPSMYLTWKDGTEILVPFCNKCWERY